MPKFMTCVEVNEFFKIFAANSFGEVHPYRSSFTQRVDMESVMFEILNLRQVGGPKYKKKKSTSQSGVCLFPTIPD